MVKPRLLNKSPIEADVMPFPREETTPPVIKINLLTLSSSQLKLKKPEKNHILS